MGSMIIEIRIIPNPPSFSRMAAKIIDPAIGASTWAFGSHRCTPYNGILIINAIMHASHRILLVHVVFSVVVLSGNRRKFNEPVRF